MQSISLPLYILIPFLAKISNVIFILSSTKPASPSRFPYPSFPFYLCSHQCPSSTQPSFPLHTHLSSSSSFQVFQAAWLGERRGRRCVKLERIEDDVARKGRSKKRKAGLMKKVSELSILCGVEAMAIVMSP